MPYLDPVPNGDAEVSIKNNSMTNLRSKRQKLLEALDLKNATVLPLMTRREAIVANNRLLSAAEAREIKQLGQKIQEAELTESESE